MHGLKQQNAFGWTDISVHVSFICFYFYLNAMLFHSDHQDILIEIPGTLLPKYKHLQVNSFFKQEKKIFIEVRV
jgi:hypothetical protein